MARKSWTGNAVGTTLASGINSSVTSFTVINASGWPTGLGADPDNNPFVATIGRGTSSEEKVLCTSRSGASFTVTQRGWDGTSPTAHAAGETVEHTLDADVVVTHEDHVYDTIRDDHGQYLNNARHDLTARHSVGTVIPAAAPGNSAVGDTATPGSSTSVARADHTHGREDFGSTSANLADAAAAGVASTVAASDHRHRHTFADHPYGGADDGYAAGPFTTSSTSYTNPGSMPFRLYSPTAGQRVLVIVSGLTSANGYISYEVTGANSLAAGDDRAVHEAGGSHTALVTLANAGGTTFQTKMRSNGGSATVDHARMTIVPL